MHVQHIGGVAWVCGLQWQYLAGIPGVAPTEEARQALKDEKASWAALHLAGDRQMLGVAKGGSIPRKAYSLAVQCSTAKATTLVVAKVGEDAYWLCVAGGSRINDKFDRIYPRRQAGEAINAFMTGQGAATADDMPMLVVEGCDLDTAWLAGATTVPWSALVPEPPVRPPENARVLMLGGRALREKIIIAGAVLLIGGVFAWDHHASEARKQKALDLALAQQAQDARDLEASQAQLRELAIKQAVSASLLQDSATPSPTSLYAACRAVGDAAGRYIAGWVVREIECSSAGANIVVALTHPAEPTFGTPGALRAAAEAMGGAASIGETLRLGSVNVPLQGVELRDGYTQVSELPGATAFHEGTGAALVAFARSDTSSNFTAGPLTPKPISYQDPTTFNEQGVPAVAEVPADRSYLESQVSVETPTPYRFDVARVDAPNVRLERVVFRPGPSTPTSLTFKVITQP